MDCRPRGLGINLCLLSCTNGIEYSQGYATWSRHPPSIRRCARARDCKFRHGPGQNVETVCPTCVWVKIFRIRSPRRGCQKWVEIVESCDLRHVIDRRAWMTLSRLRTSTGLVLATVNRCRQLAPPNPEYRPAPTLAQRRDDKFLAALICCPLACRTAVGGWPGAPRAGLLWTTVCDSSREGERALDDFIGSWKRFSSRPFAWTAKNAKSAYGCVCTADAAAD